MVAPSLALIPTGFKDGKLYSVLPESGVGDFDVVRGSGATRVNKDGLIEDVRMVTGLELITNGDFSNGSTDWSLGAGVSISSGKAVLTNVSNATQCIIQNNVVVVGKTYKITFTISDYNQGAVYVLRPTSLGSGSAVSANGTFSFTMEAQTSPAFILFTVGTTTLSIDNVSVKEVTDDTDIPRLDYTGGGCPSLLLEPQSTNLIPYSEDFSNASWTKSDTSTSNSIISPDGSLSAYKLTENTANSSHHIYTNIVAVGTHTFSVFAKKGERDYIYMYSDVVGKGKSFNLANGTIDVDIISAPISADIKDYGNGWYRCSVTITANSGAFRVGSCLASGNFSYLGDGVSGVYIWGAQFESLPYSTSYIPTSGAIATRLADLVTGAGDATTFNSTEGVLYFEGSALTDSPNIDGIIRIGNPSDYIDFRYDTIQNRVQIVVRTGGVNQTTSGVVITDTTANNKFALKYKANDIALWINGAEEITVTSASTPIGLGELLFNNFQGKVKDLRTYKTALTDAELTELTTI